MKTVALFNNKGGVGKTTLAYHLAHMFARVGVRTVAADLDPQANLTSAFIDEDRLETLWEPEDGNGTVLGCVNPILQGTGDVAPAALEEVADRLWLLPGHLGLSRFEDRLAESWPKGHNADPAALRVTTAFYRIVQVAGSSVQAEVALIDVGPNLGAINRSSLLAVDAIVFPLAADLFSLQGLRNLGPTIQTWRSQWQRMREVAPAGIPLPPGSLQPLGYVVLQHEVRLDRPVKAFRRWLARIPGVYAEKVLGRSAPPGASVEDDPNCLAMLRNYRSLMPMAHDSRKPMFDLKAADGAIGSHAALVSRCYEDFRRLAGNVLEALGIPTARVT
jgi:chromosome partitioning protein